VTALVALCGELGLRLAGWLYLRRLYGAVAGPGTPDAVNVLCLGESSTGGLWVDSQDSYPAQLERSLRTAYTTDRIRAIVPPHMGQNTSQMANRIGSYLALYHPRLVIVMAGANNEWSLAESHIGEHLEASSLEALQVRALVLVSELRLYKLARWAWLHVRRHDDPTYVRDNRLYVWGHPELVTYPPPAEVYAFAGRHRAAFAALWRADVGRILRESRAAGAATLLMTYHMSPTDFDPERCASLAAQEGAVLVRNDRMFEPLVASGRIGEYVFADDGWHPNAFGYALIARAAAEAVTTGDLLRLGLPRAPLPPVAEPQPRFPPLPPDGRLDLTSAAADAYLGPGWNRPEAEFRWTGGTQAEVRFHLERPSDLLLRLRLRPLLAPGRLDAQRIELALGGEAVAALRVESPAEREYEVRLPAARLARDNTLVLRLPDAATPSSLGMGQDGRRLAAAVRSLTFETISAGAHPRE
jgi:lysophospholipase L1-like esterase